MAITFAAAGAALAASYVSPLSGAGFVIIVACYGGLSLTIHSLFIAFTNDYLQPSEMLSASSALVLFLGLGSILGLLMAGWIMEKIGPPGFFWWLASVHLAIGSYAIWRMTRRPPLPSEEQGSHIIVPAQTYTMTQVVAEESYADTDLE